MSQNEVNEIKQHINQIVLGTSQGYINSLRKEVYGLIALVIKDIHLIQEIDEWDESELIG